MDFVDSATGTEHRGHGATEKGELEAQTGIANMHNGAPQVGTAPNATTTTGGTATTTTTAPAATTGAASGGVVPPGSSTGY